MKPIHELHQIRSDVDYLMMKAPKKDDLRRLKDKVASAFSHINHLYDRVEALERGETDE